MPTFVALLVAYTVSQFFRSFLAVVAADMARDLTLDSAQLGALSAIWFAAFAVAQFPVGYALDRFGPRRTLAYIMLAAVVGSAWLSAATNYAEGLAAMALIGLGCAPVLMASMYVFARRYAADRFAAMSTTVIGLGSIGNLIGASPLAVAVERYGWRPSLLAIAGFTAFAVALVYAVLRDPPAIEADTSDQSILGGLATILRIRVLWLLLPLIFVSYAVVIATRSLWIAPYLSSVHGLGPGPLGHAVLAMAIAMSVGALAFGPIEQRLGPKPTTIAGAALCAAAFLALGWWGETSAALSIVLLITVGGAGITYAILMSHARLFMPPSLIGRGVTTMNFAFIAGAGLLQWLSGRFVQAAHEAGTPDALTYERLFLLFGALLFGTIVIYAFAPPRPREVRGPQASGAILPVPGP
ncbi:nitrate/nitrite transporter [uncultured Enterovirga sp.]|uniref:MFS transporter n=1 Tax=uncultured Enterovirga sp. TaxID=2026352 RepID=UPI0035CC81C6